MGTVVSAFCGPSRDKAKQVVSSVPASPDRPPTTFNRAAEPPSTAMPANGGPSTTQSSNAIDVGLDDNLDPQTMLIREPLALFQKWFEEAQYSDGIRLATSMTLATASKSGRPSSRIVGVKGFDKSGFKIATNKNSRKAKDMDENPFASIMFYWESMNRMVRIDGGVVKLDAQSTADIWQAFPRSAQLTHTASRQDEVLHDKQVLIERKEELLQQYTDSKPIPLNPDWCAYNLVPDWWEFYQVSSDLPDRIIFRRPESGETPNGKSLYEGADGWVYERLYP